MAHYNFKKITVVPSVGQEAPRALLPPLFLARHRGTLELRSVTVGWEGAAFPAGPLLRSRSLQIWAPWFGVLPESGVLPQRLGPSGVGFPGGPSSEIRALGGWDLPGGDGESQEAL